jgi:hypothetical protein
MFEKKYVAIQYLGVIHLVHFGKKSMKIRK